MRAITWQGKRNIQVESVPEPRIEEPTDAIIRVTSSGFCGSELNLYEVLSPFNLHRPGLGGVHGRHTGHLSRSWYTRLVQRPAAARALIAAGAGAVAATLYRARR